MLHNAARQMLQRPGTYWHCLPEYSQGRKAIWNAVDGHTNIRRIDKAFPKEIRKRTNEQEMLIELVNGATWQVVGSDSYNGLVGSGPVGVTFSEYALCNPAAWAYISPMIEETNGWAAFITTPRGKNHAWDMLQEGLVDPNFYTEVSDVRKTKALPEDMLERILRMNYISVHGEDIGRATFEQEYYCSFNAAIVGAFYAREMNAVRQEERILTDLQHDPDYPVHRAWDLGYRDDTSIWWFQVVNGEVLVLDAYSTNQSKIDHFFEEIVKRADMYGWEHGVDFVPHDARQQSLMSLSLVETMLQRGLNPRVVPMSHKIDGINAVRRTLPFCVFHQRCEKQGIAALETYRRAYDEKLRTFKKEEVHDWASHLSDAFRYLAQSWHTVKDEPLRGRVRSGGGFSRNVPL